MGYYMRLVTTQESVTLAEVKAVPLGPDFEWKENQLLFRGDIVAAVQADDADSELFEPEIEELSEELEAARGDVEQVQTLLDDAGSVIAFQLLLGGSAKRAGEVQYVVGGVIIRLLEVFPGLLQDDSGEWINSDSEIVCGLEDLASTGDSSNYFGKREVMIWGLALIAFGLLVVFLSYVT